MTDEELDQLLAKWEEACTFAHGGQAIKTPLTVAATLIDTGDKLRDAIKELRDKRTV